VLRDRVRKSGKVAGYDRVSRIPIRCRILCRIKLGVQIDKDREIESIYVTSRVVKKQESV
jgi:hypothetical protein